jgi:hypothetical protein
MHNMLLMLHCLPSSQEKLEEKGWLDVNDGLLNASPEAVNICASVKWEKKVLISMGSEFALA